MHRRAFLTWFGRSVYAASAAVVAGAGFRFLSVPLSATATPVKPLRRRIATLDSLPTGEPQLLPVIGTRQDAWTRHADHVIGRIWVTRTTPADVPAKTSVSPSGDRSIVTDGTFRLTPAGREISDRVTSGVTDGRPAAHAA